MVGKWSKANQLKRELYKLNHSENGDELVCLAPICKQDRVSLLHRGQKECTQCASIFAIPKTGKHFFFSNLPTPSPITHYATNCHLQDMPMSYLLDAPKVCLNSEHYVHTACKAASSMFYFRQQSQLCISDWIGFVGFATAAVRRGLPGPDNLVGYFGLVHILKLK